MSSLVVDVGSFVVGEVPAPLEYQFLDVDAAPLNLTGYTVARFNWSPNTVGTPFSAPITETATVTDAVNGKVTYVWDGDEFATTGPYAGRFFVNNGTNQYASLLLTWHVCAAVGTPPAT